MNIQEKSVNILQYGKSTVVLTPDCWSSLLFMAEVFKWEPQGTILLETFHVPFCTRSSKGDIMGKCHPWCISPTAWDGAYLAQRGQYVRKNDAYNIARALVRYLDFRHRAEDSLISRLGSDYGNGLGLFALKHAISSSWKCAGEFSADTTSVIPSEAEYLSQDIVQTLRGHISVLCQIPSSVIPLLLERMTNFPEDRQVIPKLVEVAMSDTFQISGWLKDRVVANEATTT